MQNDKSKFRTKVYETVKKIALGKVLSYKAVARLAGRPKAWRMVGNILSKSRGIPCHRVIRADGGVGGYKEGTKKKITLLKKEGIKINSNGKITSGFRK